MKKHLLSLCLAVAALALAPSAIANTPAPSALGAQASSAPAPAPTAPASTPAPTAAPAPAAKTVRARVLTDCEHGKANDLVDLPADVAKAGEKGGILDSTKAAVDYAASLPQNRPKPQDAG